MRLSLSLLFLSATTSAFAMASQDDQTPINPSSHHHNDPEPQPIYVPQTTPIPTLADLLTIESSVSIFYTYVRELELSATLADHQADVSVFAPVNKAVIALPRKPNQGPETYAEVELSPAGQHLRAKSMVKRWVSAHIIPGPLSLDDKPHRTLLDHKTLSFKQDRTGAWYVVDGNHSMRILHEKKALNGMLYVIDGVISSSEDA